MIDGHFINSAYSTLERGFAESRKRKKKMAARSVLRNVLYLLLVKPERSQNKVFLLHPHYEVEKIFPNAINIDRIKSPFLKKILFLFQLGYISPSKRIRIWAAKKAYSYLQNYFSSSNIRILNCGPSIMSPFLAKLCEDKQDDSKYFIIQHGLYQHDYKPYDFEFRIAASRSVIWCSLLAQNYIALGMNPKKINVLPTHLFREIKKFNNSNKVLIIGESLNRISTDFDWKFQNKIEKVLNYLKQDSRYQDVYFKQHPRALPSPDLDAVLINNSVEFINKINLKNYGLVIGTVSTLMIEALAEGCRVLQLSIESFKSLNVGDYSLYTSIENLKNIEEIEEKIDRLEKLKYNYINSEFLRVEHNYEAYYQQLLE
jgi:hypothetical protein